MQTNANKTPKYTHIIMSFILKSMKHLYACFKKLHLLSKDYIRLGYLFAI